MESPQAVQKMLALVQNSKMIAKMPHSSRGFSPATVLHKHSLGSRTAERVDSSAATMQAGGTLLPPTGMAFLLKINTDMND
jgi:hypothetical protein